MANLTETSVWEAGIYQLETADPVLGGPDGIDNLQAKQLANRTNHLRSNGIPAWDATVAYPAAAYAKQSGKVWVSKVGNTNKSPSTSPTEWEQYAPTYAELTALLNVKAPLASPALTGTPTAPTAAAGTNTTQLATTAFVATAIVNLIASAPGALDTLNELAAALGDDPNFATTMTNALALKAPLASPALTGNPTAPTPAAGDNDTSIATAAFVQTAVNGKLSKSVAGSGSVILTAVEAGNAILEFTGALTGAMTVVVPTASAQFIVKNATTGAYALTVKTAAGTGVTVAQGKTVDLICDGTNVIYARSDFNDVALTGTPTAPTAAAGTNSTQLATTAFVAAAIANLIASAPGALDTLNELAAALGDDPNFATTITNALALKAPLASPALTGAPTAPTAAVDTNTTQLATTAFVIAQAYAKLASPTFTGDPKAPTPTLGDNDTSIATTAFVQGTVNGKLSKSVAGGVNVALTAVEAGYGILEFTGALTASIAVIVPTASGQWKVKNATTGAYTLTVKTAAGSGVAVAQSKTRDLICDGTNVLDGASDMTDAALTGTPTAPTAAAGTNTTQVATTAFVAAAIANLIASAPGALDTLNELAAALGNDPNFAATITNALALKAPLASPALTGNPTAPTPAQFDASTKIANMQALQRALGNCQKVIAVTANTILAQADVGSFVEVNSGSGLTITLPSATGIAGSSFRFYNNTANSVTIAAAASQTINNGRLNAASVQLGPGSSFDITTDGASWTVIGGVTGALFSSSGYVRLGNGLILQWGFGSFSSGGTVTTTVTLPIAFPNAMFTCTVGSYENANNNDAPVQFRSNGSTNSSIVLYCYNSIMGATGYQWFAIGY